MKFSIIIPVFNKKAFTLSCLKDLSHLKDCEIIVVDNGSTDGTKEECEKLSNIFYIRLEKNTGFAHACNVGYQASTNDQICFLNNDIKILSNHESWISSLETTKKELIGPTMGLLDSNLEFIKEENKKIVDPYAYMSGWCLSSYRATWELLKLPGNQIFSEEFGLAYFEDTDLSFRAKQKQIEFTVASIPVVHYGKQTSKQLNTYELYSNAKKIFHKKWKK